MSFITPTLVDDDILSLFEAPRPDPYPPPATPTGPTKGPGAAGTPFVEEGPEGIRASQDFRPFIRSPCPTLRACWGAAVDVARLLIAPGLIPGVNPGGASTAEVEDINGKVLPC